MIWACWMALWSSWLGIEEEIKKNPLQTQCIRRNCDLWNLECWYPRLLCQSPCIRAFTRLLAKGYSESQPRLTMTTHSLLHLTQSSSKLHFCHNDLDIQICYRAGPAVPRTCVRNPLQSILARNADTTLPSAATLPTNTLLSTQRAPQPYHLSPHIQQQQQLLPRFRLIYQSKPL